MSPKPDPEEVLRTLLLSEKAALRKPGGGPRQPTIAISRDHGALGEEIAGILAERLGVPLYDREILDEVAKAAGASRELMEQLDERIRGGRDTWIYSVFSGQSLFTNTYLHHLTNVLLALAGKGGIIVGRGAHVILTNRPVFRLRIVGSDGVCSRRLAAAEGCTEEEALARIREVNEGRAHYLKKTLKRDLHDPAWFDLIVNTDRMRDLDKLCDLVVAAMANCCLEPECVGCMQR